MNELNAKNYISEVLRQLPTVTKANLKQAIFSEIDILEREGQKSELSRYKWQILTNEVWEIERHNFVKLYKEPDGRPIAVFINQVAKPTDGSKQIFALAGEHSQATPEYLRTRCTRIKPDAPEAQNLVKFLLGNYAQRYHTEKPILI